MPKNIVVKPGIEKMPLQRLEPCGSKDPCTVLRGLGAGNRVRLPSRNCVSA